MHWGSSQLVVGRFDTLELDGAAFAEQDKGQDAPWRFAHPVVWMYLPGPLVSLLHLVANLCGPRPRLLGGASPVPLWTLSTAAKLSAVWSLLLKLCNRLKLIRPW